MPEPETVILEDAGDLVCVYGDKIALLFFNSDNCHGDDFIFKKNTEDESD